MSAARELSTSGDFQRTSYNQDQVIDRRTGRRACETEGTMAFAQRSAIEAALVENHGNVALAALQLRIGRSTVYRLMNVYDICYEEVKARKFAS